MFCSYIIIRKRITKKQFRYAAWHFEKSVKENNIHLKVKYKQKSRVLHGVVFQKVSGQALHEVEYNDEMTACLKITATVLYSFVRL